MDTDASFVIIIDSRPKPHRHRDFNCGVCYCDAAPKPHGHYPDCDSYCLQR